MCRTIIGGVAALTLGTAAGLAIPVRFDFRAVRTGYSLVPIPLQILFPIMGAGRAPSPVISLINQAVHFFNRGNFKRNTDNSTGQWKHPAFMRSIQYWQEF